MLLITICLLFRKLARLNKRRGNILKNIRYGSLILFLLSVTGPSRAESPEKHVHKNTTSFVFLENQGQWPAEILFKSQTLKQQVSVLKDGLSFLQVKQEDEGEEKETDPEFLVWNLKFLSAGENYGVKGIEGRKSVNSYFSGSDKSKWVIHPPEFKKVICTEIYDKIDFLLYENNYHLKYDYLVHSGGQVESIKLYYESIRKLNLTPTGDLEVETFGDMQIQKAPVAWQVINGERKNVDVVYVVHNDSTFGFQVKNGYNRNYDLVIDPLFQMVWSSYTKATGAGNNINYCFANAMDKDGNVYLTGMVDGTFPVTPGAYSGPGNVYPEIFVSKFSSDGTTLLYSTYLPGSSSEFGTAIAVDDSGRAYLTGIVDLNITGITNFPSTPNAFQPVHSSGSDAFLTVLNANGTGLVYSSFLGGTGSETGYGIALGSQGIAYVTGNTSIGNFPVKVSTPFPSGDKDLFVSKFDINQSGYNSLVYSVRIGGGSFCNTFGRGISVNSSGNAFVTGTIFSSFGSPSFPITPGAYNNMFNTGQDGTMCFALKLSSSIPVSLEYCTYLTPGSGNSIAVDEATNDAFIAGSTYTFAFPTTPNALQPIHAGVNSTDAFAIRLNAAGSTMLYSTFLGGPFQDIGTGIAVNSNGEAYVVGISQDSFPTSAGAYQENNAGTYDFFAVNLNSAGTGYACGGSTYVGGSDADYSGSFYDYPSPKVSLRNHGGNNDTICVSSTSHSQDFPTTSGVYGPVKVNSIADQPVFFKLTCITPSLVPNINIASSDSAWCDKQSIDFYDLSTNNPTSWQWYFQGAIPASSTMQNPTGVFYPDTGVFDVTLIACNSSGCDTVTYSNFITVLPMPLQPIVTNYGDTLCTGNYVSYQWYEVSVPATILSTDSCFIPSNPGNYIVSVTDSNTCVSSSQVVTIIAGITETIRKIDFSVAPNPFHSVLNIEFLLEEPKVISLTILDPGGRVLKSIPERSYPQGRNVKSVDFSEFINGIYFCRFTSEKQFQTIKILKNTP